MRFKPLGDILQKWSLFCGGYSVYDVSWSGERVTKSCEWLQESNNGNPDFAKMIATATCSTKISAAKFALGLFGKAGGIASLAAALTISHRDLCSTKC